MLLDAPHSPLRPGEIDGDAVGSTQVRIQVLCCGVCRTDLHLVDGELPPLADANHALTRLRTG